jgi:hypothetical protein
MFAFDVWTPCTTGFVFEFGHVVAEDDGFAASEDFVTDLEGFERAGCEGRDAGGDLRMAGEFQWYSS